MYGSASRGIAFDVMSGDFKTPEQALSSDRWHGLSFHRGTTGDVPVEEAMQMKSGIPLLLFRYDNLLLVGAGALRLLSHVNPVLSADVRPGVRHPGYWRVFRDSVSNESWSGEQLTLVFATHSRVYGLWWFP